MQFMIFPLQNTTSNLQTVDILGASRFHCRGSVATLMVRIVTRVCTHRFSWNRFVARLPPVSRHHLCLCLLLPSCCSLSVTVLPNVACGFAAPMQGGVHLRRLQWRQAYLDLPTGRQFLLLVGNEGLGVSRKLIRAVQARYRGSFVLSIEQWGLMRSLNVSVAAGIAMHNAAQWHMTTFGANATAAAIAAS